MQLESLRKIAPLLFIFVLAGFLRFYNLNWDEGHFFHPDERNIANAVSRIHFFDQLNPEFFAYGGFFIYLVRLFGDITSFATQNTAWVSDWSHINVIGRFIAAAFSTLTVIPLYFLTLTLFNKKTALVASIFYACIPTSIQIAHFGITENILVLFVLLLCLFSIRLIKKPAPRNFLIVGLISGMAVATKTTALTFLIIPACVFLFLLFDKKNQSRLFSFPLFLLSFLFTFLFLSPYSLISWDKFLESMRYESGVALGTLPVPYTLQFTNTLPYLFQLKNLFWQMGPVFLFSIFGFFLLLYLLIKKRNKNILILLIFPFIYFAYVGFWHTKFIRFMMPVIPFFVIFASYCLIKLQEKTRIIGTVMLYFFLILTISWGLTFFSIYIKEQTRITASKWVYNNIPSGSTILGEHWDDGLPVTLPPRIHSEFIIDQLAIYDQDNENKKEYYAENLSRADYIIINSRRLYGTLLNLPEQYPLTSKYYQLLFDEKLGFEKVAEFTSYPIFLGFEINDDGTEETFQVYDHPKVIIFQNVKRFTNQDIYRILGNS